MHTIDQIIAECCGRYIMQSNGRVASTELCDIRTYTYCWNALVHHYITTAAQSVTTPLHLEPIGSMLYNATVGNYVLEVDEEWYQQQKQLHTRDTYDGLQHQQQSKHEAAAGATATAGRYIAVVRGATATPYKDTQLVNLKYSWAKLVQYANTPSMIHSSTLLVDHTPHTPTITVAQCKLAIRHIIRRLIEVLCERKQVYVDLGVGSLVSDFGCIDFVPHVSSSSKAMQITNSGETHTQAMTPTAAG